MADGALTHTCSVCGVTLNAEDTWEINNADFCETHARRFIYAEENDLATKTWVNTRTAVIVHLDSNLIADYTFDEISSFVGEREIVLCYQNTHYQLFSHSSEYIQFCSTFVSNEGNIHAIFMTVFNNNAWNVDNQHYSLVNKYDKTGGRIDGDVEIGNNHYFQMIADEGGSEEEQDYYKDVVRVTASMGNYGPQLTLVSRQEDQSVTQTNCLISGVQTPHNATDAANKQYVDSNIKLPKYYSLTLNDDRIIQYGMSNAYSIIGTDLNNGYEVYLKVWYKDDYFICPLSAYHAETHGWITFDGVCILDGERWQPSIWVDQQNVWHIENKVDEITKNWVVDQFGAHTIWEVQDPELNGITYSNGKSRSLSGNDWKLQNLDMRGYKYVLAYIKGCRGTVQDQEGASIIIRIELDERFATPRSNLYVGTSVGYAINDNGVKAGAVINIDLSDGRNAAKVAMTYSNFNTTGTTALERDYHLYRLEGYKN